MSWVPNVNKADIFPDDTIWTNGVDALSTLAGATTITHDCANKKPEHMREFTSANGSVQISEGEPTAGRLQIRSGNSDGDHAHVAFGAERINYAGELSAFILETHLSFPTNTNEQKGFLGCGRIDEENPSSRPWMFGWDTDNNVFVSAGETEPVPSEWEDVSNDYGLDFHIVWIAGETVYFYISNELVAEMDASGNHPYQVVFNTFEKNGSPFHIDLMHVTRRYIY